MKQKNIARYILGLAVFIVFGAFTGTAHASIGLSIQPVKVSYTLTPGQTISGTVLITNVSDAAVVVDTKVEDFIPTAGSDGLQFVGRAPGVTTVRDWITLGDGKSFNFDKGDSKEVPFTITVPKDAEPGSHFGVAFFKATKLSDASAQLKIGTQVGMLIFVTVPGNHLEKGKIDDFSVPQFLQHGPVPFTMHFENTGTVHFEPKGEILIKNMFGKQIASVPIEGEVVLPTGIKKMEFDWNVTGFLIGHYTAIANVRDGDGNLLSSQQVGFYIVPVWYLVGFLIGLILIFFIIRFIKKNIKISIKLT